MSWPESLSLPFSSLGEDSVGGFAAGSVLKNPPACRLCLVGCGGLSFQPPCVKGADTKDSSGCVDPSAGVAQMPAAIPSHPQRLWALGRALSAVVVARIVLEEEVQAQVGPAWTHRL